MSPPGPARQSYGDIGRVRQDRTGFGGKTFKVRRLMRGLSRVPVADELLTNALFAVLRVPA